MKMSEVPSWCWVSVLAKATESTTVRSFYPFITSFAAAMGVTKEAVALCISLKEVGYSITPLLGPWLRGKSSAQTVRVGGGLVVAACVALIGIVEVFWVFALAVFVVGAAKSLSETGTQMLLTEYIPREDVGCAVAVVEIAWGVSSLIGVPLFGLLMAVTWSLP